ncbi:uncharacterized protein LOC119995596 [Tripterygium wilfordii]|uniref:uncharacterized protein LOC119995590 n=1 Tax=Tripterygium wilfordii TaxID=458696 RepID=UPI0018F82B15|nr:uncharacterized protein LOC119995590 [Tripterygium wilfordii]XP_038698037.1 uncharacterized protein LOC119995596 [Tripterygium wilfordii]
MSQRLNVQPISHSEYYVRDGDQDGQVDLQNKTCSCRVFDLDQLPCVHALAACRVRNISFNSLCSPYYTNEALMLAYAEAIYPVTIEDQRKVSENNVLLPPATRRQGGRSRQRRIPSSGETIAVRICSRCRQRGHNRQTCKEPIALTPTS